MLYAEKARRQQLAYHAGVAKTHIEAAMHQIDAASNKGETQVVMDDHSSIRKWAFGQRLEFWLTGDGKLVLRWGR